MKNDITKKHELNIAVDKYLKITDFFQSIISVAQGKTLLSIISNSTAATNLFKNLFDSAGEAFSIVKFVLVLISKYTNFKDKNLQCLLLCTLAYEYALLKTIKDNPDIIINIDENKISKFKSSLLRKNEISIDIDTFDFQCALSSSFIKEADKMTQDFFNSININEQEQRVLINSIHTNFLKGLCELKSDSSINIKFNALFKYLEAKPSLLKSKVLLLEYANYQRWVFKEKKLFNEKEFSLSDIYVALRCYENIFENGKEIYNSKYTNCITDIAKKILHYIKHEDFNSFIAINGTAGAGKSSFTLSFCDKLLEHGFIPIRIPFKHIKFDINKTYFNDKEIYNILNASINFKDISCYGDNWPQVPNNLFCNGEIFDERIPVGEKYMSPYIIILDGWDELNTEIQNKLKYFLEGLYNTFIDNKNNIIRVIITGRPSDNVCTYLRNIKKETPILTTCQLNFDEFKLLLDKLNYFNNLTETYMRKLVGKFESYKYYYFEDCEEEQDDIFDILKSPLIVFIIHELLTNCNNDFEIDSLFSNKSLLYKKLADITCENAGKRKEAESDKVNSKLYGDKLRDTLNKTAAIISIKGKELVSFKDLKLLLDSDELNITEDDISKIVVSYYFKGKHYNAGCEFIHKSFREFFYAEAIFNTLIKYNNFYSSYTYKNVPYENNKNDFRKTSNLYNFSRSLCPLISTKYLSKEETELFEGLLISYISRKHDQNNNYQIIIFDALISLWKWFISGKPLKYELSEDGMDKNPSLYEINKKILKLLSSELRDLNVLYGILGYNLLTLICIYNKVILNQKQIKNLKDVKIINNKSDFKVALTTNKYKNKLYTFAPFNIKKENEINVYNLFHFISINSNYNLDFNNCYINEKEFNKVFFERAIFNGCVFNNLIFNDSNFSSTNFIDCKLIDVEFNNIDLSCANFNNCIFNRITFNSSDLNDLSMNECSGNIINMFNTVAENIDFKKTSLENFFVSNCNLAHCQIHNSNMNGSKMENVNLTSGLFDASILNNSNFNNINMENTRSINNTSFIGSKINTSNLYKGNFNNTQLQNIELRQSNLLKCYLPNSNSINKNIFDCILDE